MSRRNTFSVGDGTAGSVDDYHAGKDAAADTELA